jgi:PhnB protein
MQINAYLNFNGQCETAFKFYERCLGGKIEAMIPHAGTPAGEYAPAEWGDKILHARMIIGDGVLMGSDTTPDSYESPRGFSVSLQIVDPADAERIFHALAENGIVQFPIQETFWADRFGMLVDQFGIPWIVNCGKPA